MAATEDMRGMTPAQRDAVRAERRRAEAEELARAKAHAAPWREHATPEELAELEHSRELMRGIFG